MIGYCKYCGNSRIVQKAEHMTEEEINNQASLECNCEGAREERDIQELIDAGRKSLKLVGKKSGAVERALEPFVELVARKKSRKSPSISTESSPRVYICRTPARKLPWKRGKQWLNTRTEKQ